MPVATVSRFFALLAVLALVGGMAILLGLRRRAGWLDAIRPVALHGALAVAATAMAGSLYYSEIVGYTPCKLCWYQRIGIYPLVAILAVAVARRRRDVAPFVLSLTVPTALVSVYHWTIQTWPSLEGATCDPTAPCTVRWVQEFGVVSIPAMALATVVAVSALALLARTAGDPVLPVPEQEQRTS